MITAQQLAAALRAAANSLDGNEDQRQPAAAPVQQVQQPQYAPQTVQQTQTVTPQNLTGQQLVDLIQPHIVNDQIKAALGEAMRANGVSNLPDAQPHQYATLYAAFQQVLSRFGIGGAPVQQAQPQTTSII